METCSNQDSTLGMGRENNGDQYKEISWFALKEKWGFALEEDEKLCLRVLVLLIQR